MSVLCTHPASGTGTILYGATGRELWYRCDSYGHRIVVSDGAGEIVRVFGGFGRKSGALDTPLDLVFVTPEFAGERLPVDTADAIWLAVADYGNRRVQIFELDGAVVGEVGVEGRDGAPWPPTRLAWRSPTLEVEGIEGARASLHLSAALLASSAQAQIGPLVPSLRRWPVRGARH
jgi:hypothetical protein